MGVGRFRILGVGGPRFRILGGGEQGLEYWGAKGGQTRSRHMTSFRRHVPIRYQKITFCILKSDNIEKSKIELKGIVLLVPSNQI